MDFPLPERFDLTPAIIPIAFVHRGEIVRVPIRGWTFTMKVWDDVDPVPLFLHAAVRYGGATDDSAPFKVQAIRLTSSWKVSDPRTGYGIHSIKTLGTFDDVNNAVNGVLSTLYRAGKDQYLQSVLQNMATISDIKPLNVVLTYEGKNRTRIETDKEYSDG